MKRGITFIFFLLSIATMAQGTWRYAPEKYRDLKFLLREADTATVILEIRNYLEEGAKPKMLQFHYVDPFTGEEVQINADINSDGICKALIPRSYAGFVNVEHLDMEWFVVPGDTLEVSMNLMPTEYETYFSVDDIRFKAIGAKAKDAEAINTFADTVIGDFDLSSALWYDEQRKAIEEGAEAVIALGEKYMQEVAKMLDRDYSAEMLQDIEASDDAKDVLMAGAVNTMMARLMGLPFSYSMTSFVYQNNQYVGRNESFVPLDYNRYFSPLRPLMKELFDTPLVLMGKQGEDFIHQSRFSPLFIAATPEEYDEHTDYYAYSIEYEQKMQEQFGLEHCFITDIALLRKVVFRCSEMEKSLFTAGRESNWEYEDLFSLTAAHLMTMRYPYIAQRTLAYFGEALKKAKGEVTEAYLLSAKHRAVLDKIIQPYRGNLLFLDFWGIACGPCRTGMMEQREIVKSLDGQSCRFLYIADEKDSPRESSEKFMTKNNILGEHIYVSHEEWLQLMEMFHFSGIPHGVLIAPDGTILQNDFELRRLSKEDIYELVERYKYKVAG